MSGQDLLSICASIPTLSSESSSSDEEIQKDWVCHCMILQIDGTIYCNLAGIKPFFLPSTIYLVFFCSAFRKLVQRSGFMQLIQITEFHSSKLLFLFATNFLSGHLSAIFFSLTPCA